MKIEPVTIEGRHIRLEPLTLEHHPQLCEVGLEEDLWRWIPFPVRTPAEMLIYIEMALKSQTDGTALPFATLERASGKVIGSTRFGNIDTINRHVEIGWTWIGRNWQQTMVNTEAKYLMLGHAFEILGCLRVEFKTDSLNQQSRNAIARIGAKEEGLFRNHMITASERIRHSVYYSIIDSEWPEIKAGLEAKLARRYPMKLEVR
jgi:RimJ/RimL family protein N-acetyltransferase